MGRPELAKAAGIGYSTLGDLENGYAATTVALHRIAKILQVRVEWLETGKKPMESPPKTEEDGVWADIKASTQGLGLGKGLEADEYAETHKLKFRADSLARKRLNAQNLQVAYGHGDSMLPRIHSGDAVLFDTSDTKPKDGQLYVILLDGAANLEPQVKRCLILDESIYFTADNPSGDHTWNKPKRMDSKKQPINILGRVRWIGSWED